MMKFFAFAADTTDEDELRDASRDGGIPSFIPRTLYTTREGAVAAAVRYVFEEYVEQITEGAFEGVSGDNMPEPLDAAAFADSDEATFEALYIAVSIIEFTVEGEAS